jgi:hypothetical protein
MYEVHIFEASACATVRNEGPYRPGDRHAMLILSRQTAGTEHDHNEAERRAGESGWEDFAFQRAGTLVAENLNGKDSDFMDAYEHAMQGECSVIAYSDPIANGSPSDH